MRQHKINSMTDREKRANAAEARLRPTKCSFCDTIIAGVPYERLSLPYCCLECIREHIKKMKNASL